jgi:23S rRNA (guanosine2251-2'-O)-methyltransferase
VLGKKPVLDFLKSHPGQADTVFIQQGKQGKDVARIVELCKKHGIRYTFTGKQALDRQFPTNHQGFAVRRFSGGFESLEDVLEKARAAPLPVLVVLDQVQDPGNVGTLARTLYGLGGGGILLPKHNAAFLGSGAMRSSAGALADLPVARETNLGRALDQVHDDGFFIVCAMGGDEAQDVHAFSPSWPVALVMGSEQKGVRPGIAKRCDAGVRIHLARELDSLNVAQAAAIILGRLQAVRRAP